MRRKPWRLVAVAIACGVAVALATTGLSTGSPTVLQQSQPTFSCCEHDIKVAKVDTVPEKTEFQPGLITVRVIFLPEIHWKCDVADKDCFAFYNVKVSGGRWQEFDDTLTQPRWVNVTPQSEEEEITTESPLKARCDGKPHKGQWMFVYTATIKTNRNQVRNKTLKIDMDIPAAKGTSYTLDVDITGVDRAHPNALSDVKVKKEEKKEKPKNK
jgi:hypothetical protein